MPNPLHFLSLLYSCTFSAAGIVTTSRVEPGVLVRNHRRKQRFHRCLKASLPMLVQHSETFCERAGTPVGSVQQGHVPEARIPSASLNFFGFQILNQFRNHWFVKRSGSVILNRGSLCHYTDVPRHPIYG